MTDPLSRVFSALADPTRRDLVARLAAGDATVGQLAAPYRVTVQAVSKHVKVLEDAGLVSRSGDSHRRPVHLEADVLDLMTAWIERYRRQAEERYERLDAVLAVMDDDEHRHRRPKEQTMRPPPRGRHRGRPEAADHPDHPGLRRDPAAAAAGAHRPRPVRPLVRARRGQVRIVHWDARTGGSWRYVHGRDGDEEYGFRGTFHEVRPDRIVQTFTFEASPTASRWRR